MATTVSETRKYQRVSQGREYATFYVSGMLMGVDIQQIQEINRHLEMTPAPHAPDHVCGVVNLRGEVVTVVDLRKKVNLPASDMTIHSRNLVVNSGGEQIGLLVDSIADVIHAREDEFEAPPANVSGVDGRFISGIYKMEKELCIILNVDAVLSPEEGD